MPPPTVDFGPAIPLSYCLLLYENDFQKFRLLEGVAYVVSVDKRLRGKMQNLKPTQKSMKPLPKTRKMAFIQCSPLFFNGHPCAEGHVSTRYTANWKCTTCHPESQTHQFYSALHRTKVVGGRAHWKIGVRGPLAGAVEAQANAQGGDARPGPGGVDVLVSTPADTDLNAFGERRGWWEAISARDWARSDPSPERQVAADAALARAISHSPPVDPPALTARSRGEAAKRGHVRYASGKACKRGHFGERYTSTGACVTCLRGLQPVGVREHQTRNDFAGFAITVRAEHALAVRAQGWWVQNTAGLTFYVQTPVGTNLPQMQAWGRACGWWD